MQRRQTRRLRDRASSLCPGKTFGKTAYSFSLSFVSFVSFAVSFVSDSHDFLAVTVEACSLDFHAMNGAGQQMRNLRARNQGIPDGLGVLLQLK
jgi:hypothetical protein